jgi:putative tricarboxylic transport membrane protein
MRFNNAVFGVTIALFSIAVWAYSGTFPEMPGQAYGPALFPRLIAAGLLICGVGLIVDGVRTSGGRNLIDLAAWTSDSRRVINVLFIPIGLLFYIGLSDSVGFLPIAFVLLSLMLWLFGTRPWRALLLAGVTTVLVHTLFYQLLHVPLPWGVLEQYAW